MSLWGLVSSISDSGKAFIASTARDIADFKHALDDETKDMQQAINPSATAAATTTTPTTHTSTANTTHAAPAEKSEQDSGGTTASSGEVGSSDAAGLSHVSSSLSALTSNIERLGGRVIMHLLPAVFKQHDSDGTGEAAAATTHPPPSAGVSATGHAPPGDGSSSGRHSSGGVEQRLLAAMRDARTYESDPVDARTGEPPAAYFSFSASFDADCSRSESESASEWAALLTNHPSIRHWHEQLVETGQVDEQTFWCRYTYVRQSLQDDERRRQKLADRLAVITTASKQQQTGKDDELEWEDDDCLTATAQSDQEHTEAPISPAKLVSPQPAAHRGAGRTELPLSDVGYSSQATAQQWRPRPHVEGDSASAGAVYTETAVNSDADSESDGELLSPSPVSSEDSGELVEHQEAAVPSSATILPSAADSSSLNGCEESDEGEQEADNISTVGHEQLRTSASHATVTATATSAPTTTLSGGDDSQGSDYDDWE